MPKKLPPNTYQRIEELFKAGVPRAHIADQLQISRSLVYKHLNGKRYVADARIVGEFNLRPENARFLRWARITSLHQAQYQYARRQIDLDQLDRFVKLWTWSAPRFSGLAGVRQDNYEALYGPDALQRRRRRVALLFK